MSPAVCTILMLVHAGLLVLSAGNNSVTFDEYAHLPAGVAYWKFGWQAFPIHNLSPPLLRMIAAGPVMLASPVVPSIDEALRSGERNAHWNYGEAFLRANRDRYHKLFVIGRLVMIPISCLGLWVAWKWAGELYGPRAATAAAMLWAFEPDLIAHGSLAGTDMGTAVAMLANCWLWWRYCRNGAKRDLILTSVAVAAALVCKFTALLVFPMLLAIAAFNRVAWRRAFVGLLICIFVSWLAVNATYGFRMRLPWMLPDIFVEGFRIQSYEQSLGVPAFLFGESYVGTKWYYYPVALACKLPVAGILLLIAAIARRVAKPQAADRPIIAAIGVFLALIVSLAHVNIGVRYILPAYPLAIILISGLSRAKLHPALNAVRLALLAMFAFESLWQAPRYLSFINFAAGGADRGWRIVNDSNFDWGQGLLDLKTWLDLHGRPKIALAYFGRVEPSAYGIDYSPITSPRGDEQYVVVSTYFLNGLEHRLATPAGHTGWVKLPYAEQLRRKAPIDRAGPTLFIYRAEDAAAAAREARDVSP